MTRFLFDHRTLSHEKDVGWAKARERCAHHLPAIACDVVSTLAPPRHCERSEAIQKWIRGKTLDCFATLAMTMWVQSLPKLSSRAPDAVRREVPLRKAGAHVSASSRAAFWVPALRSNAKSVAARPGHENGKTWERFGELQTGN